MAYSSIHFNNERGGKLFSANCIYDSGNNYHSLISKELLEENNINYWPLEAQALNVNLEPVRIIGRVQLRFTLDKSKSSFVETFYVPSVTSKVVNLGLRFLQNNKINLLFDTNEIQIEGVHFKLPPYEMEGEICAEVSKIPKLKELIQNIDVRVPGIKNHQKSSMRTVGGQKFNLTLCQGANIVPGGATLLVKAPSAKFHSREWYVGPNTNKILINTSLMVLEGVYRPNSDGTCLINLVNMSGKEVKLQKGIKIACGFQSSYEKAPESNDINSLSTDDLLERIRFLKENLRLDENEILKNDKVLKGKLLKICLDNFHIFSKGDWDIGHTNIMQFNIQLQPGAIPTKSRVIPLNPTYEKSLREQLDNWLKSGVISEGMSNWSSPIFAVRKKGVNGNPGKLRFVVDYRLLNNQTVKTQWPLPLIQDNLERLGEGRIFSTLDLTQAYHSMPVDKESRPYTAFTANNKQYLFNRLPFGLSNAPSYFCMLMQRVMSLNRELENFSLSYLDDIIIYSKEISLHLSHIEKVFKVLGVANLKLNLNKCNLFTEKCQYLGHIISKEGTRMDEGYLDTVKRWAKPRTGKDMQRFLGFAGYYREYFKDYAKLCHKLDGLRNKDLIEWDTELNSEWDNFKNMFNEAISKSYPQWENPNPFIFDIDYSSHYYAGVISQVQEGKEKIIGISNRKCNGAEGGYPAWKGEMACLVFVLKKFLHLARFRPFVVRTDSMSLTKYKTWTKNSLNGVTHRWISFLQSFDFTIEHRAGKLHANADNVSRGKFLCKEHSIDECTQCVNNNTLDPYLDTCPLEDQIFNVEGVRVGSDKQAWILATQNDTVLSKIKNYILEGKVFTKGELEILNGREEMLVKLLPHLQFDKGIIIFNQPLPNGKHVKRPVAPLSLYNEIFELAHSGYGGGHRGVVETTLKINSVYFLPGVNKLVETRINNCINCLRKYNKSPKHNSVITQSARYNRVWGCVSIDLIGPWTEVMFQGGRVKFVLILVCLYSRYVFAHPIADATTESTVKCLLEEFIPTYGLFSALRSDRGTNFTSQVFKSIMQSMGVKTILIPARNPNSNPVERYNKGIYNAIRSDTSSEPRDWAKKIKMATFVINISKNKRTGYSPYFVVFGRQPLLPLNVFSPVEQQLVDELDCKSYVTFLEKVEQIMYNITGKEEIYLEYENRNRGAREILEVNDIVYAFFDIAKVGISRKLQSFYAGPFIVSHKFSNALFEITPIHNCNVKSKHVITRDKLRKIHSSVKVCGEKLSFNVYPLDLILPSNEILLSYSNPNFNESLEIQGSGDKDFVTFDKLMDNSDNEDMGGEDTRGEGVEESSNDSDQGGDQGSNQGEYQEGEQSQYQGEEQDEVFSGEGHSFGGNADLTTIPGESSFWNKEPIQSSPEKLVSIPENRKVTLPEYVYTNIVGKNYGTRSKNLEQHYEVAPTRQYTKKNKNKNN